MTNQDAVVRIKEILAQWTPGTFENGYKMAEFLRKEAGRVHDETSDAQSVLGSR